MRHTSALRRRIERREAHIVIVGQGYVGLSLAAAAACEGFEVTGIDVSADRVRSLRQGELAVPGVAPAAFAAAVATGRLVFTAEHAPIADADVVCICVPTPVRDHAPDLSCIERASKSIAEVLTPRTLVVLESTTYPGTTDDVVRPSLEASGLRCGVDFALAYSPERIDPGNDRFGLQDVPRVVGGVTTQASELAAAFYHQLVGNTVTVSSARTAELAKLLENTFRQVNIALVNEMATFCHELGIDVWEAIEAAASKPFGYLPFYPGPGVGGHCIPVDPTYLAWQVRRDVGHRFRIIEQAQDVNAGMPSYVADRIGEALSDAGKPVRNRDVLVLGVTYKPDVGDIRESPSIAVMTQLARRGARVRFHDPLVPRLVLGEKELTSEPLTARTVRAADCVAVLSPHRGLDLSWIADNATLIFDARNAYRGRHPANVVTL